MSNLCDMDTRSSIRGGDSRFGSTVSFKADSCHDGSHETYAVCSFEIAGNLNPHSNVRNPIQRLSKCIVPTMWAVFRVLLYSHSFIAIIVLATLTYLATQIALLERSSDNDASEPPDATVAWWAAHDRIARIVLTFAFGGLAAEVACLCGVLRANWQLIAVYAAVQLAAVAILTVFWAGTLMLGSAAVLSVSSYLSHVLLNNYIDDLRARALVDDWQLAFKCCGITVEGFYDWYFTDVFTCGNGQSHSVGSLACSLPSSCCRQQQPEPLGLDNCGFGAFGYTHVEMMKRYHIYGCPHRVEELLSTHSGYAHVTIGAVIVVKVFVMLAYILLIEKIITSRCKFMFFRNMDQ